MDSSGFNTSTQLPFDEAEPLAVGGSTCDCYRLRRYGKWHFVKRLKLSLAGDPRYIESLRKEFEVGYRLEHPALARYVELGDNYILMEYVDGIPIDEFASANPDFFTDNTAARRLVEQLLDAVRYLHHHQVLHLDLKPSNILITRIGYDLRLLDFGFCYTDPRPDTTGLTAAWAAPEQLTGGALDERTDIYAIGRILQSLPLPGSYQALVARCSASDPAARYRSVDEILAAMRPRDRRWMAPVLIVAVVAVALMALALTQANRNYSDQQANQDCLPHQENIARQESLVRQDSSIAHLEPIEVPSNEAHPLHETAGPAPNIMPLRRDLRERIAPIFNRVMGQYKTAVYDDVEQEFMTDLGKFINESRTLFSEMNKKYGSRYDRETINREWEQVILSYHLPLQWQMQRNAPNHSEFYDTVTFEFYKFEF